MGLSLMVPEFYRDVAGFVVGTAIFAYQRRRHGARPADRVPAPASAAGS